MADFGGFQMQTPQEVLAQLAANRSRVMVGGDINQQRSQNIESALDGLFGNPQVRAAQRNQDALRRATANLPSKQEGEDDLDFEMRRLKAMRDAVADVSPETASQLNMQLLKIGEEKFQRARLTASDKRAEEEHGYKIDELKDEKTLREATAGRTYVLDKATGNAEAYDLRDEASNADFIEAAKKPNTMVITPAMAAQIYMNDADNAVRLRAALARAENSAAGGSKVEQQRLSNMSGGLFDLYATADRIFQVFDANPDALTGSAKGGQALDKLATELGAAGRLATGAKLKDSDLSIDDWLKANSITSTRMRGLVVGLAYATAKANDPAGRISDKDLAAAVEMIGGDNPNPASILSNLNDNLTIRTNTTLDQLKTATPATREALQDRINLLEKRSGEFKTRLQKYTQGAMGSAATGVAAPDADIDALVNKYKVPKK